MWGSWGTFLCTGFPRSQETAPPPQGPPRAIGMVLLQGPRGALLLMSEVPLYDDRSDSAIVTSTRKEDLGPSWEVVVPPEGGQDLISHNFFIN